MKQTGKTKKVSKYEKKLLKAGNQPTVQLAIAVLVEELLRDLPFPPTDLDLLRERLHIVGINEQDIPMSGELRRNGKALEIVYSAYLTKQRQRFTIAHEMGHALLHKLGERLPHTGSEVERLCDQFAAEILMPREVFLKQLGSRLTIERLFELRKMFDVSLSSVAHKCFELKRDSVFEIEREAVTWGTGLVKKGPCRDLETGLRLGINDAKSKQKGNLDLYFVDRGRTYRGELEWLKRSHEKILFVLRRSTDHKLAAPATGL